MKALAIKIIPDPVREAPVREPKPDFIIDMEDPPQFIKDGEFASPMPDEQRGFISANYQWNCSKRRWQFTAGKPLDEDDDPLDELEEVEGDYFDVFDVGRTVGQIPPKKKAAKPKGTVHKDALMPFFSVRRK